MGRKGKNGNLICPFGPYVSFVPFDARSLLKKEVCNGYARCC